MRICRFLSAGAVLLITVAACSVGTPPTPNQSAGVSSFTEQLYWAERDGLASDAQLAALRKAEATGSMSYEELEALTQETFECFEASGVEYWRLPDAEVVQGIPMPDYAVGEPIELGDICLARHSLYAGLAYQVQPRVLESRDAALISQRPQILACLAEYGVSLDSEATIDEMLQAVIEVKIRTSQGDNYPVDCAEGLW